MSAAPVELEGVAVALRGTSVLDNVTLRVEPNEYLAILGPNGGGKTTLLKVILGLLRPDAGSVRVFGKSPRRARGRVGLV